MNWNAGYGRRCSSLHKVTVLLFYSLISLFGNGSQCGNARPDPNLRFPTFVSLIAGVMDFYAIFD